MAALLRQGAAARSLGGSMVQRAEAEGRRRLGQRLVHTDKKEEIAREIQQKKEELYDAIAKAETRSFQNIRLLQHLSVQVRPRPWDFEWRHMQFSRRVNSVMETAGFIALGGLAAYAMKKYEACVAARERLWAGVMSEEEQEELSYDLV